MTTLQQQQDALGFVHLVKQHFDRASISLPREVWERMNTILAGKEEAGGGLVRAIGVSTVGEGEMKIEYGSRVYIEDKGTGVVRRFALDPSHPTDSWWALFEVHMDGGWFKRVIWTRGYNLKVIQNNMDSVPEVCGR